MKNMQAHMRLVSGICVATTVALMTVVSVGSDIELVVTPTGPYYGDLPIYVDFAVTNRSTNDTYVWSVGRGSGAVRPGFMMTSDGTPVPHPDHVDTDHWERMVRLPAGGALRGRKCISSWSTPTNGLTGEEFLPGDYSVILRYKFGTNRSDVVSSTNVVIHVGEPGAALEEARARFQGVIHELQVSTNPVMPKGLEGGHAHDCYSVSALNRYALWLQSRERYDEALVVWRRVLDAGDSPFLDTAHVKVGMAACYFDLGRKDDARRILEGTEQASDEAFGVLWKLNGNEGPPPVE